MKPRPITIFAIVAVLFLLRASGVALAQTAVWTQHMDNWRTGWNLSEKTLNPTTVSSSRFGLRSTVSVDGAIDAQPLVEPNQQINCLPNQNLVACQGGLSGTYEVVYVATENASVYAIDASTGAVLLKRNFLVAGASGGIQSTPVIDTFRKALYFVTISLVSGASTLTFHAVNLADLSDYVPPYNITSSITATLSDGSTYAFNPNLARSRAALLYANGSIYVAIGALGEFQATEYPYSRGWLLQFSTLTLAPINAVLIDSRATSANNYFISSIWMSRTGPAADDSQFNANIYFSTGNSDPSGTSFDPKYNLEESVVEVSQYLAIVSSFTPHNYGSLDSRDDDLGSGGVLKIPTNYLYPGPLSLVATAGKDGTLYLLNAAALGGYTPGGPDNALDIVKIGQCWCSPSFFVGPDGVGRIVSSGGSSIILWDIARTATSATLTQEASAQIATGNGANYQPGFFTTVSSDYYPNGSGVIWAVNRPTAGTNAITLYAFSTHSENGALKPYGQWAAGAWNQPFNSNIVPVVANGRVYVASDGVLTIFGLATQ